MGIILPSVSAAFAAFCVWLTVRIINRRERWAKWTLAATVGLPVLYVLSFGPACWYIAGTSIYIPGASIHKPHPWFGFVYLPIGVFVGQEPQYIRPAACWYGQLGAPEGGEVFLPSTMDSIVTRAEGVGFVKLPRGAIGINAGDGKFVWRDEVNPPAPKPDAKSGPN